MKIAGIALLVGAGVLALLSNLYVPFLSVQYSSEAKAITETDNLSKKVNGEMLPVLIAVLKYNTFHY